MKLPESNYLFTTKNFFTALSVVVLLWFVWTFNVLLSYFLVAAIISLLGKPIVDMLEKIKIGPVKLPKSLCALLALAFLYAIVVGLVMLFTPLVIDQANKISQINTDKVAEGIQAQFQNLDELIVKFQQADEQPQSVQQILNSNLQEWISGTSVTSIFSKIIGGFGNILITFFSVTFISFFFLRDDKLFYRILMALTPAQYESGIRRVLITSRKYLTRYFIGLIIQSAIVFILISAGLYFLGIQYWLLIGFFAGIVNIIPYVGPIIGMLFGMLIAVSTNLDTELIVTSDVDIVSLLVKLFILFQGVQLIDNFISQPIIYSNSINAHPLEVFFIVLVFATLAGIPGMIVAMPVYAFFRIILREFFSEFKIVKKITASID